MEKYPFIFSNERKYRLQRHIVFWAVWWIMQGFLYSFVAFRNPYTYPRCLLSSMIESLVYLIPHMFLSYSLMYFVIPRFLLKQKYWLTAIWAVIVTLITAAISGILGVTIIDKIRVVIIGQGYINAPFRITIVNLFLSLMAGLRGGMSVGGIAAAIKLMKYWYIKEQRNFQLQKENIASQLQLLKAQVHPHFLFNTLNNIFSYTQKVSPTASTLVMGLSDLLRYILHEGSQALVPLEKELKMLDDYIVLEQIRYSDRLEINKEIPAHANTLLIAPLLLLPFVENCFKHGASNILEQAWIRLAIDIDGNKLKMTLINAKVPGENHKQEASGIGIMNARKRLELLYLGKHELNITEEEDVFIVNLRIELEKSMTTLAAKETNEMMHA